MKSFTLHPVLKCAGLLIIGGSGLLAHAGVETNATPRLATPVVVRSVFVDDPTIGKDPFFPASTRRGKPAEPNSTPTAPAPPSALFNQLALKGISGVKGQRLALINSSTLSVGEQAEIRSGQLSVKILCREIRDSSVLIELVGFGEVREIKLRQGI